MAFLEPIAEGIAEGLVKPISHGYRDLTDGIGDIGDNTFDWAANQVDGLGLGPVGDVVAGNLDLGGSLFEAGVDGLSLGPAIGQQGLVEGLNTIDAIGAGVGYLQFEHPADLFQDLSDGDWNGFVNDAQGVVGGLGDAISDPFRDSPGEWGEVFGHVLDNDILGNQEGHNSPLTDIFEGSPTDYWINDDTNNDDIVDFDRMGSDIWAGVERFGQKVFDQWQRTHPNPLPGPWVPGGSGTGPGGGGGGGGSWWVTPGGLGGGIAGGVGGIGAGLGALAGGIAGGLGGSGGGGPVEQGMNRAEAQRILHELQRDRERLLELLSRADSTAGRLQQAWEGEDSSRYGEDWSAGRQAAEQAVHRLEQLTTSLEGQITQQDATSSH